MTTALIWILIFVTGVTFVRGIIRSPAHYLTPPVMGAGILLTWFIPQALLTVQDMNAALERGTFILLLSANLAFANLWIGWGWGKKSRKHVKGNSWPNCGDFSTSVRSLGAREYGTVTTGFVGFSALVQVISQMQPAETLSAQQPSGLITILMMLWALNPIALFLGLTYFLVFRTFYSAVLATVSILIYAAPILINFKRNDIVEFATVLLFSVWLARRWSLPRLAVPVGIAIGIALLFGVAQIRNLSGYTANADGSVERQVVTLETFQQVDWSAVMQRAQKQNAEFVNGAYSMDYITRYSSPAFGRHLWNTFVKMWIPGQLLGREFKDSLYADTSNIRRVSEFYGSSWETGTTSTGFPEGFSDFDYFSSLIYALIGYICGRLYRAASRGDLASAAIYMGTAVLCLPSLTHGTYAFFMALPIMCGSYLIVKRFVAGGSGRQVLKPDHKIVPSPNQLYASRSNVASK